MTGSKLCPSLGVRTAQVFTVSTVLGSAEGERGKAGPRFLPPSRASSCGSPKSCSALKSRAYGGSFLLGGMLRLSDAQYHAALSGHHCPSVLRSSQPPTRKSRPATTTRSL